MLTPQFRELLRGPNFAVITTINADGTPQQSDPAARECDRHADASARLLGMKPI
jgi:hypothetical protein